MPLKRHFSFGKAVIPQNWGAQSATLSQTSEGRPARASSNKLMSLPLMSHADVGGGDRDGVHGGLVLMDEVDLVPLADGQLLDLSGFTGMVFSKLEAAGDHLCWGRGLPIQRRADEAREKGRPLQRSMRARGTRKRSMSAETTM